MKKTVQRAAKPSSREFGDVLKEFLAHHRVPEAFTFEVRNQTLRRPQNLRKVIAVPKVTRTTSPAMAKDATVQDLIRAFLKFLAPADLEDKLSICVVRAGRSRKADVSREINGHKKLSTLREDAKLAEFASLAVLDFKKKIANQSDVTAAKAFVQHLAMLVGKPTMIRFVQAL